MNRLLNILIPQSTVKFRKKLTCMKVSTVEAENKSIFFR